MLAEALFFSAVLFTIGMVGVLTRRNAIILFMCVELMLNAVNLTFVAFAQVHGVGGQGVRLFRDDRRRRGSGRGAGHHHRALPPSTDREPSAHQSPQGLMLLPQALSSPSHPLTGTVADWIWLIPLLPLLGFVINGALSLLAAYHAGPADPGAGAHGGEHAGGSAHAGAHPDGARRRE